ncbi:MAG: hypothetical protein J6D12_07850 [Peptostreptococcaceae bacterium]|nr:hypothetical protein [Peptostreptococcaceae bacterium]
MRTIDTDSVLNNATTLSNKIDDINTEMTKLNTSIDDNQEGFQGDRGTSFFKILTENYISELDNLKLDLESYQDFLSKIPGAYEMLDEEFGNKNIDV